jgi:site-specific DNA-methyltransferase (adenine-specific)
VSNRDKAPLKVEIQTATLYLGDCREILPTLAKVDAVVTDPPYGIARVWQGGSGHGWGSARAKSEVRNEWDAEPADLSAVMALSVPKIIWGGNYFQLPLSRCWLVWRKEINPALSLGDAELAWTSLDKPVRVFDHPRNKLTGSKVPPHPTQKPVPLMEWCIVQAGTDGVVLDPYMGSGTTGVACANLSRAFIGVEVEREYFDIACERIEAAHAQRRLFA